MSKLDVILPVRNEEFLNLTIKSILDNSRDDTGIIVVLDGYWPNPPLIDHPKVTILHFTEPVGQRRATNLGARVSGAQYIMKLDGHCIVDEGFDVKLMADCDRDWIVTPRLYNLHAFDRVCSKCGHSEYQGPTWPECPKCKEKGTMVRDMKWAIRPRHRNDFYRFDKNLQFKYWPKLADRESSKGDIADTMSMLGACLFCHRKRFMEIGMMDEKHGSWGQFGTEIACKSWLSGGRLVVNKKTYFSHMFRTQGGDFGFPYKISGNAIDRARKYSQDLWMNNKWKKAVHKFQYILDKFAPIPDWHEDVKSEPVKDEPVGSN